MYTFDEIKDANKVLHAKLANTYKSDEPHYRTENILRVDSIIKSLKNSTGGVKLLDVGCGMGFIIDIAKNYFDEIQGIDITEEMLNKVDLSSDKCKINVRVAEVENIPFDSDSFDVCSAYAVLHHLYDLEAPFKEIFRVLKKGGTFYSDTDPNFYFWNAFEKLEQSPLFHEIVNREIYQVKYKDAIFEKENNIPSDIVKKAEYFKHIEGGFVPEQIQDLLYRVGFKEVRIDYQWFLGEAKIIHSPESKDAANVLRNHLLDLLPLTKHLFKYISIIATK